MPFTSRASHVATAVIAILGTVIAIRGPWTAQASGNAVNGATVAQQPQQQGAIYVDQYGRPLPTMSTSPAPLQQVAYAPQPTLVESRAILSEPQPAIVRAAAVRPATIVRSGRAPRPVHRVDKGASWQKQALVIGGSAGTAAGIGALIGGKKGAAIGAALGGGGAALITAIRK